MNVVHHTQCSTTCIHVHDYTHKIILHVCMYVCRRYSHKSSSNKSIWRTLLVLRRRLRLMMGHLTLSTTWLLKQSMVSRRRYTHMIRVAKQLVLYTVQDSQWMYYSGCPLCAQVYKERVLTVAMNCAQQAAQTGVKRFIHVSTAQVYNSDKVNLWL